MSSDWSALAQEEGERDEEADRWLRGHRRPDGVATLVKQRVVRKMRDHCKNMAARCKEMMEVRSKTAGHEASARKMREHCEEMATQHREDAVPVVAA
jgi:hypothetical protein